MDHRCVLVNNCRLGYDLQLDIEHLFHKFQDKDQYIFDWHKLDLADILNLLRILGDT